MINYAPIDVPNVGSASQIADGMWWIRLPLSMTLDHVNVYLLRDHDCWTLVDTGVNTSDCKRAMLQALRLPQLRGMPVGRVILTHDHHDHVGLAGYFTDRGATLMTSHHCWQAVQSLCSDDAVVSPQEQIEFLRNAGLSELELAAIARRQSCSDAERVYPLPTTYHRLRNHDVIEIDGRRWRVVMGHAHASEHVTLWSEDQIAIVGDQILPATSPSLAIPYSDAGGERITAWMEDCRRFSKLADNGVLCLPGHNRPFYGASHRCRLLAASTHAALDRLLTALQKPATAVECLTAMYRRPLHRNERFILIHEVVGHLNFLHAKGAVTRHLAPGGAYLWRADPYVATRTLRFNRSSA